MITEPSENFNLRSEGAVDVDIEVKYFGAIREAAGKTVECLKNAPATVPELLCMLYDAHGSELRDQLFDKKNISGLRDDLMITVNSAIVNHETAAEIKFKPGDVVALFPIFPGGG